MSPFTIKNMFPETITHKIFETNSIFPVKERTVGKILVSVFEEISASINKTVILAGRLHTRLSFYDV